MGVIICSRPVESAHMKWIITFFKYSMFSVSRELCVCVCVWGGGGGGGGGEGQVKWLRCRGHPVGRHTDLFLVF